MAEDRSRTGEYKPEFNQAASLPEAAQERDGGSQMVREDGFRHDMHPPTEIRAVPDRDSYNDRLAEEFKAARAEAFDMEAFFEEVEAEEASFEQPEHVSTDRHAEAQDTFDKEKFLSEFEAFDDEKSAENVAVNEAQAFDKEKFLEEFESEDAEQDAGSEHWDDFDYSTYVSAADEADAKALTQAEQEGPQQSNPLPGDRSLSEEFNQVDDDFDWRSYVSAADEADAKQEAARSADEKAAAFDKDKFLEEFEKEDEFDRGHENSSDYDHDYDM